MYILKFEEEDSPYPTLIEMKFEYIYQALDYLMATAYEGDYEFVSLVNTNSFYGKT